MASKIMHMAVTKRLIEERKLSDGNRLMLGGVLPDACAEGESKDDSHFKIVICGGSKKTYDLTGYRTSFGRKMQRDGLYLGYYLHLIQDIIYRDFVYNEYHWDPTVPGNVERLYKDYRILNSYVIRKYGLHPSILVPHDFAAEPIGQVYPFQTRKLQEELSAEFSSYEEGDIFFFTEEMADLFISRAYEVCRKELEAFQCGKRFVDEYEWAWRKKVPSLLETTLNTRELGGYRTADKRMTRWNMLIRSDVQKYPTERDIGFLQSRGITTIVDMRGKKDVSVFPSPFASMDSFQYYNDPIEEGSGVPAFAEEVPHSYMRIAQSANMPEVFRQIAKADGGVLFHCSAGKDRTGVVSAVLLSLAGVDQKDVVENFMLTKECNRERFRLIHKNFPGLDVNIVIPREEYMTGFLDMFFSRYTSAAGYLRAIGLTEQEIQGVRDKLVGN